MTVDLPTLFSQAVAYVFEDEAALWPRVGIAFDTVDRRCATVATATVDFDAHRTCATC